MRRVEVRGRYALNVFDEGVGPALLLIHGLAGDHTAWNSVISEFGGRFRVIAPDNRGAGRSTQIDEPLTLAEMAGDMLEMLDQLQVAQVHVVGRSMGGCIGQEMALQASNRVLSLALLASCAKCDESQTRAMDNMRDALLWRHSWEDHARHSVMNFVSHRFFNEQRERVAEIERIIASESRLPAAYAHQNRAVIAFDVLDRLHQINCPVLIAHGGRDPLGSPTGTGWMIDRLPQAEVEFFADSSHFFFMEEPERFMRMLSGWLNRAAFDHAR